MVVVGFSWVLSEEEMMMKEKEEAAVWCCMLGCFLCCEKKR